MKSGNGSMEVEEDMLRHILLNTLRATKIRYKEYGNVVIACDDKNYWRKNIFPYYKANRKKNRDESDVDWPAIFSALEKFKVELKENFPYKVIQVPHAEADDIIAVLTKKYHTDGILIASHDKDYQQLQKYPLVKQYSNVMNRELICLTPEKYLLEHIIKGDTGDGIPNCLSPDNSLVMKIRQKPITTKRLDQISNNFDLVDDDTKRNFFRNKALIDFEEIPENIETQIIDAFEAQEYGDRKKIFNYFMQKRMKNLMESISEF